MTQITGDKQGLSFAIVTARISNELEEKKHVIYTLQVCFSQGANDIRPAFIERRYTHFLTLYEELKVEFPGKLSNVAFPKKVLLGNFDNTLILTRSTGFEELLKFIATEQSLRQSNALLKFLQEVELLKAKQLLQFKDYAGAFPVLDGIFNLLNKVFTDRSPAVLLALCRVLACSFSMPGGVSYANNYAELALHRYEGVSDSDLLELYVPLLHTCIKIWRQNDKDITPLERRLQDLQRLGVRINEKFCLMEAVGNVEVQIFDSSA